MKLIKNTIDTIFNTIDNKNKHKLFDENITDIIINMLVSEYKDIYIGDIEKGDPFYARKFNDKCLAKKLQNEINGRIFCEKMEDPNFTIQDAENNKEVFLKPDLLFYHPEFFTEDFLRRNIQYINFEYLTHSHVKLTQRFVHEYREELDWKLLVSTNRQLFTDNFIRNHDVYLKRDTGDGFEYIMSLLGCKDYIYS